MRHVRVGIFATLLLVATFVAHALAPVPTATGYVTDLTQILEPDAIQQTQVLLGKYEVTTGRKLVVLLVPETPGEELEAFADRVLAQWQMDGAAKGGALLLWSAEGYILIRVAGPLGEKLDGDTQAQILSRWVVPAFGRGEAGVGIRQGAERMIAVLDGGEVGFPPPVESDAATAASEAMESTDAAEDAAEAVADAAEDAAAEADSDVAVHLELESPVETPPWFERLPNDAGQIAKDFSAGPFAGLGAWFGRAGDEAGQLPVLGSALLLQARGEQVEPPFHPVSIGAAYALGGLLFLAGLMTWGRAFVLALIVAGLGGGLALWVATGFTALAALLMAIGLLSPVIVPLLRAVLRGASDSERDPMPAVFPQPASRPYGRTSSRPATASRPASVSRPITSTPGRPAARPPAITLRSASQHQQKIDALKAAIPPIAQARIRELKTVHFVVALILAFISIPLAFLALLAVLAVVAYKDGVIYLLADLMLEDAGTRERIKAQLPQPKTGAA